MGIYPNIQIKEKFSNLINDGSKESPKQHYYGTSSKTIDLALLSRYISFFLIDPKEVYQGRILKIEQKKLYISDGMVEFCMMFIIVSEIWIQISYWRANGCPIVGIIFKKNVILLVVPIVQWIHMQKITQCQDLSFPQNDRGKR